MSKKIIIVNQSSGYLTVDIANELSTCFDKVFVFSGGHEISEKELKENVILSNIITYKRNSIITRVMTWFLGAIQAYFKILFLPNYELLLVSNPPIILLLGLFLRRIFSVLIYDVYPNALENIGISKNHWIFQFWEFCNRCVYKKTANVITISEGMKDIISRTCDKEKIFVVQNWSSFENIKRINKEENPFVMKYKLEKKFIILYSGNIGLTHQVDKIIDIAINLKDEIDIVFVIIGDGFRKQELIERVIKSNISSVIFLPFLPVSELPYSFGAADVSIVTLNEKTALLSVPSKTYNYLAIGSPLLCIAPYNSELNRITSKYNVGKCFEKDDINEMVEFILLLKKNPSLRLEYAKRSIETSKYFTKENAKDYVTILTQKIKMSSTRNP
jgi:glycosyltransferase involved in cell wall biosynthesis